jgi:type II secretory pathway pseudopilin PulG
MMSSSTSKTNSSAGFTIPEVIIAGVILIIICVGTAQTFIFATRINRGNNLRMQALSVLQAEVEHYRSLKFVPGPEVDDAGILNSHRAAEIRGSAAGITYNRPIRTSKDGQQFNLTVVVTNLSPTTGSPAVPVAEYLIRYKRITITATPVLTQSEGWLSNSNLNTTVTLERVRSN